ncbi:MAG: HNH endonuclease [Alphaproteobacteria bacterium]|nr:MAG: HNH endonuclease [Alphaproteobacteria bacterium]
MSEILNAIRQACAAIDDADMERARRIVRSCRMEPAASGAKVGAPSIKDRMRVFLRDGFIDRYSGDRLVFPAALRILSLKMPDAFPFHEHWKMSECHIAYWHLLPTIDHVVPVSRGGTDDLDNLVSTSQLRNSAKGILLLEELGWKLHSPGKLENWDGMLSWFFSHVGRHPELLEEPYIRSWHRIAREMTDQDSLPG